MDQPEKTGDEADDESLANRPPMPLIEVERSPFGVAVYALAALGGAFVLVECLTPSVQGATRSAKLKWQHRQVEIQQAEFNANGVDQQRQ